MTSGNMGGPAGKDESRAVTPEVIILGAGLAGLAAAQRLTEARRSVVIVEARDRIGGRVWTHHDPGVDYPIELGPEWFDGGGPVHRLLAQAKARLYAADGAHWQRTADGLRNIEELTDGGDELHRRLEALGGPDRALDEALDDCCRDERDARARQMLLNYVQGFHAADPSRLSLHWLTQVERNQPAEASDFRSRDGVDGVVSAIHHTLGPWCTIRLETTALAVRWRPGGVEIDVQDGRGAETLTARSAIVTLPLSVLAAMPGEPGAVAFAPALDGKRAAFTGLAMGPVIKTVLVFDEAFWQGITPLDKALFVQDFSQAIPTWWTTQPVSAPILTGWVAGPQVARLKHAQGDALRDAALDSVAHALGVSRVSVESRLKAWHVHDWQRDPFARGAYTWVVAGGTGAHRVLAAPVDDTLYFAGEATCGEGFNATMDGAIESGWRAAGELLRAS